MGKVFISQRIGLCVVVAVALAIVAVGLIVGLTTRSCEEVVIVPETTLEPTKTTEPKTSPVTMTTATDLSTDGWSTTEEPLDKPWHQLRLPISISPEHYSIYIYPDMTTDVYYGQVDIHINVEANSSYVILHAQYINIANSTLVDLEQNREIELHTFMYEKNQYWVAEPDSVLIPGLYQLSITYSGDLMRNIVGIYKSIYVDEDGNSR